MNIFFLARCPVEAAHAQCDRHVVKMILESAQLLSTAHHELGDGGPYKPTHKNHPSAVWARQSRQHYGWLYAHMLALGDEYTERYGKVHKTIREHSEALREAPAGIPDAGWIDPPQCMPDECKIEGDTVAAYQRYYDFKNSEWTKLGRPMTWLIPTTTTATGCTKGEKTHNSTND